jgi:hypothetical protein
MLVRVGRVVVTSVKVQVSLPCMMLANTRVRGIRSMP